MIDLDTDFCKSIINDVLIDDKSDDNYLRMDARQVAVAIVPFLPCNSNVPTSCEKQWGFCGSILFHLLCG